MKLKKYLIGKLDGVPKPPKDQRIRKSFVVNKTQEEIEKIQSVRDSKYILAWKICPHKMLAALAIEFTVSFGAILTSSGDIQLLPSIVSALYLLYVFLSSKTNNTYQFVNYFCGGILNIFTICDGSILFNALYLVALLWTLQLLPALIALDIVQVHWMSTHHTIIFASADAVIFIASINYAIRTPSLENAVPLLISFDFLTKLSSSIVEGIAISDEDALYIAKDELTVDLNKCNCIEYLIKRFAYITAMLGVVVAALILVFYH